MYKISDRYFQLGETFRDVTIKPINNVAITANTGGANQSIALINPQIKVVKNQKLTFGLSTTTLACLLYTSPSPRDKRQSRMPSSA